MDQCTVDQFIHLAETLHFGRASKACNVTPSTLSRSIQRLEEQVGHRLFERDNRSVRLTAAGEIFREYAVSFWAGFENLKTALNTSSKRLAGTIALYCSVTASYTFLPVVMEKFRRAYPDVHIRLETGVAEDAVDRIVRDDVEVAVAARPERMDRGLRFLSLGRTPLVCVQARGERQPEPDRTLSADMPLILPKYGLARRRVDAWFRGRKRKPTIFAEVSGNEAIIALASLGCGTAVVPKVVLENSPLRERMVVTDMRASLGEYDIGLCTKARRLKTPVVKAFWECASRYQGGE
jgi:LysR family transcriptional regulator, positive regulator for ilvC